MKISAHASGGFCGISQCYALDTSQLKNGKTIERLVAQLDFDAAQPASLGADLQRWQVTVDDGGTCRTAEFADDGRVDAATWRLLLAQIQAQPA